MKHYSAASRGEHLHKMHVLPQSRGKRGEQKSELHMAEVPPGGQQTCLWVVAVTIALFEKQSLLSTPKPRRNQSFSAGRTLPSPLSHYSNFRWDRLVCLGKVLPSFLISACFQQSSLGGEKKRKEEARNVEEGSMRCPHLLNKEKESCGKQLSPWWPVACLLPLPWEVSTH